MADVFIIIQMNPVAKARARTVIQDGRARTYTPDRTATAEAEIRTRVLQYRDTFGADVPIRMVVTFYMPRPKRTKLLCPTSRPDLTNLEKTVEDAMNGIVYPDDAQIVEKLSRKEWTTGEPCLHVRLTEYQP